MHALLIQVDGKLPNIALMRLAAHLKQQDIEVSFRQATTPGRTLFECPPDLVYASAIFQSSRPVVQQLLRAYPQAVIGGTGHDVASSLEAHGVITTDLDYSLYPEFQQSIGFTQRGCRLRCPFCVVPAKEGRVRQEKTITEIWRGDPWPRELLLLDNDFFGQPQWQERVREICDGRFKVSFTQGINCRCLTEAAAEAIANLEYRDSSMKVKRLYTAWDNRDDEERLFTGLKRLVKYGVKPDHIMVYMLIGYWDGETEEDRLYRQQRLREFGARPYPMPYVRTHELVGFQRWCIGAYDKRISWADWKQAQYRPERL